MNLKAIIEKSLEIPVIELFEPILPPCATWMTLAEESALSGDGEETETAENIQIDIWSGNRNEVKKMARKLKSDIQREAVMTIPDISYMYDENGRT